QFFLPKTFKVQDISVFVIGQILGILPGAEVVISYNYYSTATAIWLKSPQMTSILQAVKMVVIVSISSGFVVSFGAPGYTGYVTIILRFCIIITNKNGIIFDFVMK